MIVESNKSPIAIPQLPLFALMENISVVKVNEFGADDVESIVNSTSPALTGGLESPTTDTPE